MEMKKYKLENLCTKITDGSHYSPVAVESGYPMFSVKDMEEFGFSYTDVKLISEDDFQKMCENDCVPQKNDVLVAKDGSYLKEAFVCMKTKKEAILSSIAIFRPNIKLVNPYYLAYLFKTPNVYNYVTNGCVSGTALPRIVLKAFKQIEVFIPSLKQQNNVVSVLSSLDDKIVLNKKINAKLEAMAKRLYDYWFVQFDFPNEEGKPYKTSGGKMVWNEVLKREIPEGWEVKRLGDVISTSCERINTNDIKNQYYVPIEVIPRNKMSFHETAALDKAATGLCSFKKRSILLSNRRVYFHKVCISPFDGITRDTVIIINPKQNDNLGFVYQIVNSNHFIDYATVHSYGSEQPVLSTPAVLNYRIIYPNCDLDMKYNQKIESFVSLVLQNEHEIQKLTELRDRLLPLLMNGQVEVEG